MTNPEVSVLMPIRNEENWIIKRINSILEQDFDDYELIIVDNASTDDTEKICKKYTQIDKRIHYYRHHEDIGSAKNFTFALNHATGRYIVFAGGHDLWSKNYLNGLLHKFNASNKIVITFGETKWIDKDGNLYDRNNGIYSTEGVTSHIRRFNIYMWADQNPIYGMMRKDVVLLAWPRKEYMAGGQLFLQRMAILGQFAYVPGVIFYRRENRPKETRVQRLSRYQTMIFNKPPSIKMGVWKSAVAIIISAWRYPSLGNVKREKQHRVMLVVSSLCIFIRLWPHLWHTKNTN